MKSVGVMVTAAKVMLTAVEGMMTAIEDMVSALEVIVTAVDHDDSFRSPGYSCRNPFDKAC